jgi:4-amino-4-deoxy-L-arabinose transferase-like glycosyltransferase
MIYLALAWRVFGFAPLVTRAAMLLLASATVASIYWLGRRVIDRETTITSAALLTLSPLFFAQSTLAHLDLTAGLFTTLAVLFLLEERFWIFALMASLAILCKETAVILLPVVWLFSWHRARTRQVFPPREAWFALSAPLLPLIIWAAYCHHVTGYWTGNREYLSYNLYSTMKPGRIPWTLFRRLYEVFLAGFDWILTAGSALGIWFGKEGGRDITGGAAGSSSDVASGKGETARLNELLWLTTALAASYVVMLSVVGGAVLPRYLLPVFPLLFLAAGTLISRLPRRLARLICFVAAAGFISAWFLNPPYPFPFEDNLAYADFVRLHQQAAKFLTTQFAASRILTAWPASDELTRPDLGYVPKPLEAIPIAGFTSNDFDNVAPGSFELLYLYSRKWEPPNDLLKRFPWFRKIQARYFDYQPQTQEVVLINRYHLKLLQSFERRGQWVRIYAR